MSAVPKKTPMTAEERKARNREYMRRYYRENREASLERSRSWAEANPERVREVRRRNYEANSEERLAYLQQWREANPERRREVTRRWREAHPGYKAPGRLRRREVIASLLRDQGGKCYLCDCALAQAAGVLEHDHRCCPKGKFCSRCIRGISCADCNWAIGLVRDDFDRLRHMADALELAMKAVDERVSA